MKNQLLRTQISVDCNNTYRRMVTSFLIFLSFFPQFTNAESKRILFQGSSETLFEITIFIDEVVFDLDEETDPFTQKKQITNVQGVCQGGMEIVYKGKEDFIFDETVASTDLNLLYKDPKTSQTSTYMWTRETDLIYKSGDRIAIDTFHPTHSDYYENPSQNQIDEIKSASLYRCNHENIIGIRNNRPNVHVRFRSGTILVGQSFWDHSRVSIVEVKPKFIRY